MNGMSLEEIDYQRQLLESLGYSVKFDYSFFDGHICASISHGGWRKYKACVYPRKDYDSANILMVQICETLLNEAWVHFHEEIEERLIQLKYIIGFGDREKGMSDFNTYHQELIDLGFKQLAHECLHLPMMAYLERGNLKKDFEESHHG